LTTRAACANSGWLTSTTWATIDSTSFSNSESANTALTTSYVESSTFTPGAITIDGIAVKIASRSASPTGTMSIRLAQGGVLVTSTEITVNVSDLPTCSATSGTTTPVGTAEGGWFFIKFGSSVTLAGATAYTLSAKTSSSSQVNLWSASSSNWSRYLRTTTTGNMVAGDDAIITGEWTAAATVTTRTVTMDETATTDYGGATTTQVTPSLAICKNGVLTYSTGIAANLRQSGHVIIYNGGTLSIGASGAEVARGSTAVLQMDCASDGDFGLIARNGAILNMYGLSRTVGINVAWTYLAADASAAATSLTTSVSTGWLSGDVLCLAPTARTGSQYESKAMSGNATGTTVPIAAITNAHSGTAPIAGAVGNLTRNVKMTAVSANVCTFVYVGNTAAVNFSWAEFVYCGQTAATSKKGWNLECTTGSFMTAYCSIHDGDTSHIYMNGSAASNVSITNTISYNSSVANGGDQHVLINSATSGTWTIDTCMICGGPSSGILVQLSDVGGTFTNNDVSGNTSNGTCISFNESAVIGTFSGNNLHTTGGLGFNFASAPWGTISSCKIWRNNGNGANLNTTPIDGTPLIWEGCDFFGNNGSGANLANGNFIFSDCTFNSDSSFTQSTGLASASAQYPVNLYNCQFSVVGGIKTQCTADLGFASGGVGSNFIADKCTFNGVAVANQFSNINRPVGMPVLTAQNFGGTANDNRAYFVNGTVNLSILQSDSGTVHGTDPLSQKMTPASASVKLRGSVFYIPVNSGVTSNVGVYVQKNGTYNGNAPRLILLRQDSMGVTADTVCDTLSVGVSTWEQLTYTTPIPPQDGVYAFLVDCDGTAGVSFVGDWSAT
jgi:hypothetical protein